LLKDLCGGTCGLEASMPEVELSAGTIEYEDTGGGGPVVVMVGGLAIGGSLWRQVVRELRDEHRCVVPTLPMGAHRRPMRPDAVLSPHAVAMLLAEFLERLDLAQVTLVENDTGRTQTLVGERPGRVARLVLVSCEAFDNYPPGLPGRTVALAARLPGGLNALIQPLRLRPLRRLPLAFGWMTKRPAPHEVTDGWLDPLLTQRRIRRDLTRYMLAAAERLPGFNRPALVVWATEDRVMPPEHGRRLAELLPNGRLVEIPDSYTLIPQDQPGQLARAIRQFIQETP
jgi:pimeloyl-ACP methyl ester carboxylesterase